MSLDDINRIFTPDVKAHMFKDCLDSLSAEYKPSTNPTDIAMERGKDLRRYVIEQIRPLLANPLLDWQADRIKIAKQVAELYANGFALWNHDDLVWLLTVLHANMLMGKIQEQCG